MPEMYGYSYSCYSFGKLLEDACKEQRENRKYQPKRIIFNNPATIVFWQDGTKTVVKCEDKTEFNPYYGFCAALAKKVIGNNSKINRLVKNAFDQQEKEKKDD